MFIHIGGQSTHGSFGVCAERKLQPRAFQKDIQQKTGKVPGISGVCARLLVRSTPDKPWRLVFLVGLIVGASVAFQLVAPAVDYRPQSTIFISALAGLIVGLGTRIGGGCTQRRDGLLMDLFEQQLHLAEQIQFRLLA